MYRLLVVLVTIAVARSDYSSFGYSSYPSLSHGGYYQPPQPQQPLSLSHFSGPPPPQPPSLSYYQPPQPISLSHYSPPPPPPPPPQPSFHFDYTPSKSYGSFGDYSDNSQFESGKRGQNENQFSAQNGRKGDEFQESSNGFKQGNTGLRGEKSDSGFFSGENGEKRFSDDGKQYFGDKRFQQEGMLLLALIVTTKI